jgi:hypothetical protein
VFLWGVFLAWWLSCGTAATIFGGTRGLLVYLLGILIYLWAFNFRLLSPELTGLIFIIGAFVVGVGEILDRKTIKNYPVKNQATSILVGGSSIAALMGIFGYTLASILALGLFIAFPFRTLVKKYAIRQWVISYFSSLLRIFFVLIVNLMLLIQFIKVF